MCDAGVRGCERAPLPLPPDHSATRRHYELQPGLRDLQQANDDDAGRLVHDIFSTAKIRKSRLFDDNDTEHMI